MKSRSEPYEGRVNIMILKEFELDLPYVYNEESVSNIMQKNKFLQNEATKLDYEINWKQKRRNFRLETRCITAMFERLFEKFITEDCWKVLVECAVDITEKKVHNFSGVYTVQVEFQYNSFMSSNEYQKKQMALNAIMEGVRVISNYKGWKLEPFESACIKIHELNYTNEWIWMKAIKKINNHLMAEVLMRHEIKTMNIYILIKDVNGLEIGREKIISEKPDEFAYNKHLGKLKWISCNEVVLVNKKGDKQYSYKL